MLCLPDPNTQARSALAEQWASRLAAAFESVTGRRPRPQCLPESSPSAELEDQLWWCASPFSVPPGARLFIGVSSQNLCAAGLGETGLEGARTAWLEVLNRAASGLAQWLSARWGRSVASMAAETVDAQPPSILFSRLELDFGGSRLPLLLAPSDSLERALQESPASAPLNTKTLDLLMEVELPVSLSFGRARLPLRDVLKLTSGSIVELNRAVGEPVELIVNNAVIARGQVVVVEGNYGVKISQIISRQERLRTLR
jgi:flagellar motor switch protein FliN